jgi:biopolymer transport protein ExbD
MQIRAAHHVRCLTLPVFAPFTSVLLALNCLFLLIYYPVDNRRGVVALHETPLVQCQGCFNVPDLTQVIVSLSADGRTSFAVSDTSLQALVLQRAIGNDEQHLHGTPSPKWLVLTEKQLITCIVAARTLSPSVTALPASVCLMIDEQTKSSAVMHLLNLLRQQRINRLNLLVHCRA